MIQWVLSAFSILKSCMTYSVQSNVENLTRKLYTNWKHDVPKNEEENKFLFIHVCHGELAK